MKTVAKRTIAVLLTVILLAQAFGALSVVSFATEASNPTEKETVTYTDDFSATASDELQYFSSEPQRGSTHPSFKMPESKGDGTFVLKEGDSLALFWREIPNIAQSGAYTLTFDVKITDFGSNDIVNVDGVTGYDHWNRELYIALGGYWDTAMFGSRYNDENYTKITTKNTASEINEGRDVTVNGLTTYQLDRVYSVEIVWDNIANTITSTIKSAAKESIILTGTRTYTESSDTLKKGYEDFWAFRCEDGAVEISGFSFSDGNNGFSLPKIWTQGSVKFADWASYPHIENGVITLTTDSEISFNWKELKGINGYSATDKYTFEFDFKPTDFGNGAKHNGTSTYTRILYVAFGGYYDLLIFNDKNGEMYSPGSSKLACDPDIYLNQTLHFKVEWLNGKVTTELSDVNGVLLSGSRTVAADNSYTKEFSMRCDDGALTISNFAFTNESVSYSINDTEVEERMEISSPWEAGSPKFSAAKWTETPYIDTQKSVMMVLPGTELSFDWTKVEGVNEYSANNRYTFKYDMKICDFGSEDNSVYQQNKSSYTRVLYNSLGGYYDLLSVYDTAGKIKTPSSSTAFSEETYLNKVLHVEVEWFGGSAKIQVTDQSGNLVISGHRTLVYDAMYTDKFSMRCEDGAVEMDNFEFSVTEYEVGAVSEIAIDIPNGKEAVFETDFVYNGKETAVWLGESELFRLSGSQMKLCSCTVSGDYSIGKYHVKAIVSPSHKIVLVEVTLPDGGTVRRGDSATLPAAYSAIKILDGNVAESVTPTLIYRDITPHECNYNVEEPVYEGFNANVFNLVTSFTDARYDRAFVWTALESFIGDTDMSIKYRALGENGWTYADAVRCEETDYVIEKEDYFKVEISGLIANTKYEYKIGKSDSSDEENDWSKSYFFTTEKEDVSNFSFIAIGDTQSTDWWNMRYAKLALDKAFSELSNPAFILHTGDVGQTYYPDNADEYTLYLKALGEYGASTPHFATIGNHDKTSFYFDTHFNHPNNGGNAAIDKELLGTSFEETYLKYLGETVYSYNYGNAHFICLNTGPWKSEAFMEAQRAWLTADLEANKDAKWTIILQHQNVYNRYAPNSVPWLADVIEEYGVDLLVQGDTHLVSRTYPMKNGQIVTKLNPDVIEKGIGTVYTTISSTSSSKDPMRDPNVEEMLTVHRPDGGQPTYTIYNLTDNKLTVVTKQIDGLVLDSFTIFDGDPKCVEGHTYDSDRDADCNICGAIREVSSPAEGTCGANATWRYENGVLYIEGSGSMNAFSSKNAPWKDYKDEITTVIVAEGIRSIGKCAFYEYVNLTSVTLPSTLRTINAYAFYGCSALVEITLPASLTSIRQYAFRRTGLVSVTVENKYGWSAGNMILDSIEFSEENAAQLLKRTCFKLDWTRDASVQPTESNMIAGGICGTEVRWNLSKDGVLTIEGTGIMLEFTTNAAPWSAYKTQITKVVIGEGVTKVGKCSFYECPALTEVVLPSTLTAIGKYAFYGCKDLTEITIPASVVNIGDYAFRKTGVTSVTFENAAGWTYKGKAMDVADAIAAASLLKTNYTNAWTK